MCGPDPKDQPKKLMLMHANSTLTSCPCIHPGLLRPQYHLQCSVKLSVCSRTAELFMHSCVQHRWCVTKNDVQRAEILFTKHPPSCAACLESRAIASLKPKLCYSAARDGARSDVMSRIIIRKQPTGGCWAVLLVDVCHVCISSTRTWAAHLEIKWRWCYVRRNPVIRAHVQASDLHILCILYKMNDPENKEWHEDWQREDRDRETDREHLNQPWH